jgi:hypothetical protein
MRSKSLAAFVAALMLPGIAMAGPDGIYHVKGVNPDDGNDYTGTVKIVRKGEIYRVVWKIGDNETIGMGIGLRLVDGQMVAGPASDNDTGISISYSSANTFGNAIYSEFSDGTWRGVWAFKGYKKVSTEEWIPTVRQIKAKSFKTIKPRIKPAVSTLEAVASQLDGAKVEDVKVNDTPARIMSSPMPASASPKS